MSDLGNQILKALGKKPGPTAREIATKLGIDKKRINNSLYGELKSICAHDKDFRWYLRRFYFLDFETNIAKKFYLMGYSAGSGTSQIVLNPDLKGLAIAKGFRRKKPPEAINDFLEMIKLNNGVLVAYSLAEKEAIAFVDANYENFLLKKYKDIPYLNLRIAAKKWICLYKKNEFNHLPPLETGVKDYMARQQKNSLASIMRLTGFPALPQYGAGKTTKRFNSVIEGLIAKKQNFDDISPLKKRDATNVLEHNKYDVEAIKHLFEVIKEDGPECFSSSFTKLLGA